MLFNRINLKTLVFNLKYFPLKVAYKLPVVISKNVSFRHLSGSISIDSDIHPGMIKIGFGNVGIFDRKRSKSILEIYGRISFKGTAQLGHGTKLSVGQEGCLEIGDNFKTTAEVEIISFNEVIIGNNCLVSWNTIIIDTDFHTIKDNNNGVVNIPKPIIIEDDVWIGLRSSILKGSYIPRNCVIASNTMINKRLPTESAIYGGIPAKLLRENITWHE